MFSLILIVVFALITAFFATQNTHMASITMGNYRIEQLPMYVVIIASILFGIFVSWLLSLVDSITSSMTLYGKDSEIKKAKQTIGDLQKKVHVLEIENARLAGENNVPVVVENIEKKPSFFQNLRQSFS